MKEKLFNLYVNPLRFYIEDNYIAIDGKPLKVLHIDRARYYFDVPKDVWNVLSFTTEEEDYLYISYRNIFWLYYYFFFKPHTKIVRKSNYPELCI